MSKTKAKKRQSKDVVDAQEETTEKMRRRRATWLRDTKHFAEDAMASNDEGSAGHFQASVLYEACKRLERNRASGDVDQIMYSCFLVGGYRFLLARKREIAVGRGVNMDRQRYVLNQTGDVVELTPKEGEAFQYLQANPEACLSDFFKLLGHSDQEDEGAQAAIRTLLSKLRKKTGRRITMRRRSNIIQME